MERLTLLALLTAALGLAGLFAAAQLVTAAPVPLGSITLADAGRTVQVCGSVASVRERNGHHFFTLEQDGAKIPLIIFSSRAAKLAAQGIALSSVTKGSRLCAAAVVDEYPAGSGSLELVHQRGLFTVADA